MFLQFNPLKSTLLYPINGLHFLYGYREWSLLDSDVEKLKSWIIKRKLTASRSIWVQARISRKMF